MMTKKTKRSHEDVRQQMLPFHPPSDTHGYPSRGVMIMSERHRFNLTHYPLPKNAEGKTFYDKSPGYCRFARSFQQLIDEPGLGVLTSEAGVGKTTAIRNACTAL